jgi:hypothetical protein
MEDSKYVLPFIQSELDADVFTECVVVQDYLDLLDVREVPYDESLRTHFRSETYVLSELINPPWSERAKIGFEKYGKWRKERFREHFTGYTLADYQRCVEQCRILLNAARDEAIASQIRIGVEGVLLELAERDSGLFRNVLDLYLAEGNPLGLWRTAIPAVVIARHGPSHALGILTAHQFQHKRRWLFDFYEALPPEHVNATRLEELYSLYQRSEAGEFPYSLDFLTKYAAVDPEVLPRVVEILVERAEAWPRASQSFGSLFDSRNNGLGELPILFAGRRELLERAYLVMQQEQQHADYDGAAFNMLLDWDPDFARRYIDWIFEHHATSGPYRELPDPHDDHRRYDFIWRREDYAYVVEGITEGVYELEKDRITYRSYLNVFYAIHEPESKREQEDAEDSVQERQDRFLADLIVRHATDIDFVEWLFGTVGGFSSERRYRLLNAFLAHNRRYDDFRKLQFDRKMWMANGSFVPVFQKYVEVLESFLPLFRSADLLRHRKRIEDEITDYRSRIAAEKKRDFLRE